MDLDVNLDVNLDLDRGEEGEDKEPVKDGGDGVGTAKVLLEEDEEIL